MDGIDVSPVLLGFGEAPVRDHLYWEFHAGGGLQAVRMGRWKGVRNGVHRDPDPPVELYDLQVDPEETTDVAAENPEVAGRILDIMRNEHAVSDVPGWNFGWNEGAPGPERPKDQSMEIGPGQEVRRQFLSGGEVVIDGGVLRLSGPANPLNGVTVRFTRAGGALVLEKHTPDEFRRKHRGKIRTKDGVAVEGADYEVVELEEGGCAVKPTFNRGKTPTAVESPRDLPDATGFEPLAGILVISRSRLGCETSVCDAIQGLDDRLARAERRLPFPDAGVDRPLFTFPGVPR